jgi:hypothetical protein
MRAVELIGEDRLRADLHGMARAAHNLEDVLGRQSRRVAEQIAGVPHGAVGTLARPRAFVVAERFPEDQLPAIVVESPGTADLPAADGQGRYAVRFELVLTIAVATSTGAIELAKLYALALRALAVQQPSALFMGVDWINERYPRPELVGGRTFYTAEVTLEVQVPDVTNRHEGPPDEPDWPDIDDGGPNSPTWGVAQSVDAELEKVPIDEPVEGEET